MSDGTVADLILTMFSGTLRLVPEQIVTALANSVKVAYLYRQPASGGRSGDAQ